MASVDDLFRAIYGQESGAGANTRTSVTGARGGMQIQPATFAQYAKPGESIDNPADNVAVGKRIIQDLYNKSGGDPARVAVGYFSGPGNIAPPGSPTPYVHNFPDPNGKYTASYASDVLGRLPSRPVTPTPGTTLTSTPAAVSRETSVAPVLSPYQMLQKGDIHGALAAVTANKTDLKTGQEQPDTSPLGQLGQALQPKQQQPIESPPMLQPQDSSAAMIGPSQQLLAQILASSAKPLTWSSRPYGAGLAGQQTTLNTPGGLYNG